ncbi:hypothetical protein MVEN_01024700 [Mycena venus]|uniref:ARM repeat-containing protein n=1 Tax=Mycena venus TaxID=2733690 RepID=A0A8H7D004_9AGAR|nr:hypothetical protein MVEN_01024700 [Mycena venus]
MQQPLPLNPLGRQQTCTSILSWWSDSNPFLPGPTINLHAAAKPLSRFLHHRQALDIIRKNQDSPLSSGTLDIYASYLPWNTVSWSTKSAILREIASQVQSDVDVHLVVNSAVFPLIMQLLESPSAGTRISSCRLLAALAWHESKIPAILELKPCEKITAFLHDKNLDVVREAIFVLFQIAQTTNGAEAIVDANVLDYVVELLESEASLNLGIRNGTRSILMRLAGHASTAPAIFLPLLDSNVSTLDRAIIMLDAISERPDGTAVLEAIEGDALGRLEELSHNGSIGYSRRASEILDRKYAYTLCGIT